MSYRIFKQGPGPWFNIKMSSYQYRKSHCGDKTILLSSYLHNGISCFINDVAVIWYRYCITNETHCWPKYRLLNTLRPRQNGRHFADDIFKRIFFNENVWILLKISLKFVSKGPINKIQALFQIMAWRRPGDKPLSEAMLVSLLTHNCVTRPQWVNN